jgi:hypothetical protein
VVANTPPMKQDMRLGVDAVLESPRAARPGVWIVWGRADRDDQRLAAVRTDEQDGRARIAGQGCVESRAA